MSFTVSAAITNVFSVAGLKVLVVTGATEAGGANASVAPVYGAANAALTPAHTGSLIVFGLVEDGGTWTAFTPEANCTLIDNLEEGATGNGYADGDYTGTVTASTPVTIGSTAPAIWSCMAGYELIPSAGTTTPLIDASTPAIAHTAGSSPVTTASFTPPAGAVLVAIVLSSATATAAVTITDTSGLGLTWTLRGTLQQAAYEGLAGIYTTSIPPGGTSATAVLASGTGAALNAAAASSNTTVGPEYAGTATDLGGNYGSWATPQYAEGGP